MKKLEMLEAIEHAKKVHLEQMYKIESMISGHGLESLAILGKTQCVCGIWFHANEKAMKEILGLQLFERLDKQHEAWHRDYAHLHELFEEKDKKGFFAKLIEGGEAKEMKIDKAKLYFSELLADTQTLMNTSDVALRRINALSEKKFN